MKVPVSALAEFTALLEQQSDVAFTDYNKLQRWCCDNPDVFWSTFFSFSGISHSGEATPAVLGAGFLERKFFPQVSLNYTRCLLEGTRYSSASDLAVTVVDETERVKKITREELGSQALAVAAFLQQQGIVAGDRVVAIAKNSIESIAACLGCAAIGATWSSVSPELGEAAIIERFGQLEPKLLFTNSAYQLNGGEHNISGAVREILNSVPSIGCVALLAENNVLDDMPKPVVLWAEVVSHSPLDIDSLVDFPFDHPLFVMFSSGTTGAPKCIVHGAGGTLLEHLKEHRLHSGLSCDDVLLFQTSTGWMMWNWQLSALASGTPIVLYDGSVSYPDKTSLLKVIADHNVTVFGTSPAFIQFLIESGVTPKDDFEFPALRAIQSTGSVLYETQFKWINEHFKNVPVQSVSGGTDMIGCLVLGHPELPVQVGDSQCLSLGIDVQVLSEETGDVKNTGTGELVVTKPFPSQPVFMWNDPDQKKINSSYFEKNPGVWTHGDQIRISESGSPRILGRSDGTLNIRGVRIGPSEILTIVNQIDGVKESMAIEQASPREPGGSRLVLLLVMQSDVVLERPFVLQLKKKLATEASRLHVPAVVTDVQELPRTHNGKLSEKAARDAANRVQVKNIAALANPASLDEIQQRVPLPPE